ncbi:VWA domain-containing protein [Clostridium tagluense]|uniref:vWA domain-containing protein n=1 Tax=Clostridium tagluense TaxID=360422 RepID=UPI001CF373B7|nr:vWA domain-containing protein [Clostridium tagluense]MCB2312222.1 VWA domain-containing protein [Clostridium tagluense]MCB2316809.1 VWA domain-containing protein [Clostridium tagluense]MCB2321669.1 VWA domain-containing protein [Clostridium tagluense]MCB2326678.1 VWA domain-containing protein [Clostridium tagluense]MCB2331401.1 VWA domain-containing protein [Clostridium tagluense]
MNHNKKVNRLIAFMIVLTLQISCTLSVLAKPSAGVSNLDVIFVLDVSGSMKTSDPEEIRTEAIKMFLDMCGTSGNKVGLVAYSDNIIRLHNLAEMNSADDKDSVKRMTTSIPFGQKTDTGMGIKEAVKLMESGHEDTHKPIIILLSDGKNDPQRSMSESLKDLNDATNTAKSKEYPIYTIGLNYDGTVDKAQLQSISSKTKGKTYITNKAEELTQILTDIYADNSKINIQSGGSIIANGGFQEVKLNIPNDNVLEANVSMLSDKPVSVKLVNPKGVEISIPSKDIIFTSSSKYSMLKIVKPVQGDWIIKVKGVSGDKINISYIFNYDIELEAKFNPVAPKIGQVMNIEAYFLGNGKVIDDNELYKDMKAKIIVKNLKNGDIKEFQLQNGNHLFSGKYTLQDNEKYEVKIRVDGKSFYRETSPMTIGGGTTVKPSNNTAVKKPAESDNKKNTLGIVFVVLAIIALIIIVIAIVLKKKNKAAGFGRVMFQIRDENTSEVSAPQHRSLHTYNGKFSLYDVLGLKEEFSEVQDLKFHFKNDDSIEIANNSQCSIQKSGRVLSKDIKTKLYNGERIVVILNKSSKSIILEFYSN